MFTPGLAILYLATILRLEARGMLFLRLPGRNLYRSSPSRLLLSSSYDKGPTKINGTARAIPSLSDPRIAFPSPFIIGKVRWRNLRRMTLSPLIGGWHKWLAVSFRTLQSMIRVVNTGGSVYVVGLFCGRRHRFSIKKFFPTVSQPSITIRNSNSYWKVAALVGFATFLCIPSGTKRAICGYRTRTSLMHYSNYQPWEDLKMWTHQWRFGLKTNVPREKQYSRTAGSSEYFAESLRNLNGMEHRYAGCLLQVRLIQTSYSNSCSRVVPPSSCVSLLN